MTRGQIETSIQELYIGILGRAADYAGLKYWADQISSGAMTLEHTRASFASPNQPEYWSTYGGLSASALVDKVYENFLERTPDVAGKTYWVSELTTGAITSDFFVNAVINAAKSPSTDSQTLTDAKVLANKVESAQYFTTKALSADSSSAAFIAQAKAAVSNVNHVDSTVAASKTASDQYASTLPLASHYDDRVNDAGNNQTNFTPIASNGHVDGVVNIRYSATQSDNIDIFRFKADKDGLLNFNYTGDDNIYVRIMSGGGNLMDTYVASLLNKEPVLNFSDTAKVFAGETIEIAISGTASYGDPAQTYSFDYFVA